MSTGARNKTLYRIPNKRLDLILPFAQVVTYCTQSSLMCSAAVSLEQTIMLCPL